MRARLHVVTDDAVLRGPDFEASARGLLEAHGPLVALHLRGHGSTGAELFVLADRLAPTARATGGLLLVNDRIDVALLGRAAGAQLGRRSLPIAEARNLLGPGAVLGYSAHTAAEAEEALRAGADFALVGAIYPSASHPGAAGAGPALVRETVVRVGGRPVLAIGGVTPERVAEVLAAGAYGVAVVGGVWRADRPERAAAAYLAALEGAEHADRN